MYHTVNVCVLYFIYCMNIYMHRHTYIYIYMPTVGGSEGAKDRYLNLEIILILIYIFVCLLDIIFSYTRICICIYSMRDILCHICMYIHRYLYTKHVQVIAAEKEILDLLNLEVGHIQLGDCSSLFEKVGRCD
jgi:hypothetical protein